MKRVFEVQALDGRLIRHEGESADELQKRMTRGYTVVAEVFGASANGMGGYSIPVGGPSLMAVLLDRHGDELKAWLAANFHDAVAKPADVK